eukprot:589940_1
MSTVTNAKIMKQFKNIDQLKTKCKEIDASWRPSKPGRVASAVQANVFEDCRYNNNAHAVMSEVLDYLEKYGFIGMYDEIVTQENNESSSEVQPLEQNNINETSQLVVTEDDDEDAKQSEQSKDMEDAQKKPKKPKKPRGGNKRGLGKFVCVAKPSEIEKKKK